MRFHGFSLIAIFLVFGSSRAGDRVFAIPLNCEVPVYANEQIRLYEKPIFTISPSQHLIVIESGKNSVKIQDADDKKGWVEKRLVSLVRKKAKFEFDTLEIKDYIDLPSEVQIIDGTDPTLNGISLNRSFADALRDNVDRETITRQTAQSFY